MTSTPELLAGCGFVLGRGLSVMPAMTILSSAVGFSAALGGVASADPGIGHGWGSALQQNQILS